MATASRSKFQPNFVLLCEELNLDSILPYLHQERMVTRDEYETVTNPAYTLKQRRGMLLGFLPRKGSRYYENFSKCLVWSGQVELARHIGVDVGSIPPSPHQRVTAGPGGTVEQNDQDILHAIKKLISSSNSGTAPPPSYSGQSGAVPGPAARQQNSLPSYQPSLSDPSVPPPPPSHVPAQGSSSQQLQPSSQQSVGSYAAVGGASHASGHAYQPLGPGSRGREYHSAAAGGVAMSSSREQERPSGHAKTEVFILYCKDSLLSFTHGVKDEEFCQDILELADVLMWCGGINCSMDVFVEHEGNWNQWTLKKIEDATYVIMVCSPQLMKHFSYGGENDVHMYKGMFYSSSVVNLIKAPKFIPVFLNNCTPGDLKLWVPAQLHTSRLYCLRNLRELHERVDPDPEGSTIEERADRLARCLHDPQNRELAELVRRLRKERDAIPPEAPARPIPLPPSPHNSPLLSQRANPHREGTHLAEYIRDDILQKIAGRLPEDWVHLGVKLGVEYSTCSRLKAKYGDNYEGAVLEVIATWQRLKGVAATKKVLKRALIDVGFGRLASECFPHIKL